MEITRRKSSELPTTDNDAGGETQNSPNTLPANTFVFTDPDESVSFPSYTGDTLRLDPVHDATYKTSESDTFSTESAENPPTAAEGKAPQEPGKKSSLTRKIIWALVAMFCGYAIYCIVSLFISADRHIQQVYLVPRDAAFIIQTSEPVADWKKFSESAVWQSLKRAPSFAGIQKSADGLDSLLQSNKILSSLVGKRDLLISLHRIGKDWDALILVDLQKLSKIELLKNQIDQLLKLTGNPVTRRDYKGIPIIEMRDTETRDMLYMAFIDNHFAASYTSSLVERAVDERETPAIGLDAAYLEADRLVAGKGLCRVYIHYDYLPKFVALYLQDNNEFLDVFSGSMNFAGLYMDTGSDRLLVKGYTLTKDDTHPYVTALFRSGRQKMKAHEILSARTGFYANFGFDDPKTFVQTLEKAYAEQSKEAFESYRTAREKIEKYFGISLDEQLLGWMAGEIAVTQSEPGLLGREPEYIMAIRAKSIKKARENMELLEKRIRRRSPIKIKAIDYKGYDINYVEMKGFFRLFFGKLFDRFEKPYYTYIDDYVVFSNQASSLLSFIEDYRQGNLLKEDPGFKKTYASAMRSSSFFAYLDMEKFFPHLEKTFTAQTRENLSRNKDVLFSLPQWSLQIADQKKNTSLQLAVEYRNWEPPLLTDPQDDNSADEAVTEKELMSELKRFYVEKFEGNILRDYYPEGALLYESEMKNGVRHGRYREFYESGALRARGKFSAGKPKGTWKYYTEEGKFERKLKF